MKRPTGRFQAEGSDGRTYEVRVWTDFVDVGDFDDPDAEVEGLKGYELADGRKLNRTGPGEYLVVATGARLRSSDPAAQ